jgi:hypothetical protein
MKGLIVAMVALWWCRVEPVHPNGDDYLYRGVDVKKTCTQALENCFRQYGNLMCKVVNCGVEGQDPFIALCEEVL